VYRIHGLFIQFYSWFCGALSFWILARENWRKKDQYNFFDIDVNNFDGVFINQFYRLLNHGAYKYETNEKAPFGAFNFCINR